MSLKLRALLSVLLTLSLAVTPAVAAPAKPLGHVVSAERAHVGTAPAVGGATVYVGDQLSTETGGTIRVRVGTGQIYLLPFSAATLAEVSGTPGAEVIHGALGFSSSGPTPVVVRVGDAVIRPKDASPTHARIELLSPGELMISNYRGTVEVVVGAEVHTVAEATAARVSLASEFETYNSVQGTGAEAAKRRRALIWTVGILAAAAVAGVVAWRASISAEKP